MTRSKHEERLTRRTRGGAREEKHTREGGRVRRSKQPTHEQKPRMRRPHLRRGTPAVREGQQPAKLQARERGGVFSLTHSLSHR